MPPWTRRWRQADLEFERSHGQGDLFGGFPEQQVKLTVGEAKATVLDKLEQFLSRHSASEDLGLRLDGEQLAAGVRFVRLVRRAATTWWWGIRRTRG